MRLLFIGDIMGRSGRQSLEDHLPSLKENLSPDVVVVNGENAAAGFGITRKIVDGFLELGVDCITGGNHSFDQREVMEEMDGLPRLLRPINYPPDTPGKGTVTLSVSRGRKVLVINAMARIFMDPLDDPFRLVDECLKKTKMGRDVDAILVDFHGEATSEKMAMGQYLDGRVSLVVGTHSHVPTADAQILPKGTAYQTDAGMCGDYDSVIGMEKDEPLRRFTKKVSKGRFSPAMGEATLCGVFVETDDRTGLATSIEPVRIGGRLKPSFYPR